ncbi:MAG TPA: hypothetical protein ENH59_05455 [Bacteroidetes bacterium]|nr:hypothetical protein [Bacteroidota bacterium]
MKGIILLLFLVFLLSSSLAFTQVVYESNIYEHMDYLRRDRLISDFNPKAYENIDGTPYLIQEYEEGKVYLKSGEVLTGKFRFDLYANQVQFTNEDRRYVIAYPEKIYKIELNGNTLKYIDYKIDAGIDHNYFFTLIEGYYSLYLKKSKTLKDPVATKPYQQARPARFLDHKDYYYVKIGENPAKRVRNKKDIVKMCEENFPDVRNYMKEEKLRISDEYDLVKLITHINGLLLDSK